MDPLAIPDLIMKVYKGIEFVNDAYRAIKNAPKAISSLASEADCLTRCLEVLTYDETINVLEKASVERRKALSVILDACKQNTEEFIEFATDCRKIVAANSGKEHQNPWIRDIAGGAKRVKLDWSKLKVHWTDKQPMRDKTAIPLASLNAFLVGLTFINTSSVTYTSIAPQGWAVVGQMVAFKHASIEVADLTASGIEDKIIRSAQNIILGGSCVGNCCPCCACDVDMCHCIDNGNSSLRVEKRPSKSRSPEQKASSSNKKMDSDKMFSVRAKSKQRRQPTSMVRVKRYTVLPANDVENIRIGDLVDDEELTPRPVRPSLALPEPEVQVYTRSPSPYYRAERDTPRATRRERRTGINGASSPYQMEHGSGSYERQSNLNVSDDMRAQARESARNDIRQCKSRAKRNSRRASRTISHHQSMVEERRAVDKKRQLAEVSRMTKEADNLGSTPQDEADHHRQLEVVHSDHDTSGDIRMYMELRYGIVIDRADDMEELVTRNISNLSGKQSRNHVPEYGDRIHHHSNHSPDRYSGYDKIESDSSEEYESLSEDPEAKSEVKFVMKESYSLAGGSAYTTKGQTKVCSRYAIPETSYVPVTTSFEPSKLRREQEGRTKQEEERVKREDERKRNEKEHMKREEQARREERARREEQERRDQLFEERNRVLYERSRLLQAREDAIAARERQFEISASQAQQQERERPINNNTYENSPYYEESAYILQPDRSSRPSRHIPHSQRDTPSEFYIERLEPEESRRERSLFRSRRRVSKLDDAVEHEYRQHSPIRETSYTTRSTESPDSEYRAAQRPVEEYTYLSSSSSDTEYGIRPEPQREPRRERRRPRHLRRTQSRDRNREDETRRQRGDESEDGRV